MRVDAATGGTAAYDEMIDMASGGAASWGAAILETHDIFLRLTQRRAGHDDWIETARALILVSRVELRPAALHIRCQSSGTKARAMETGPSCCTKG